jgi:hypothetical protein
LAFLLIVVLLVLFWPITYKIRAHRKEGMTVPVHADIRMSWLFGLLRFDFVYPERPYGCLKLLFFTLFRTDQSDEKVKKKKRKKKKRKHGKTKPKQSQGKALAVITAARTEKTEKSSDSSRISEEKEANEALEEKQEVQAERREDEQKREESDDESKAENEKTVSGKGIRQLCEKVKAKISKTIYTFKAICAKIKTINIKHQGFVKRIKEYLALLENPKLREMLSRFATQLRRIWKNVRPRKVDVKLTVGLGDPALTGKVLQFHSLLYPFTRGRVIITPDFDREVFQGTVYIRGRITVFVVAWAAWQIYKEWEEMKCIERKR